MYVIKELSYRYIPNSYCMYIQGPVWNATLYEQDYSSGISSCVLKDTQTGAFLKIESINEDILGIDSIFKTSVF